MKRPRTTGANPARRRQQRRQKRSCHREFRAQLAATFLRLPHNPRQAIGRCRCFQDSQTRVRRLSFVPSRRPSPPREISRDREELSLSRPRLGILSVELAPFPAWQAPLSIDLPLRGPTVLGQKWSRITPFPSYVIACTSEYPQLSTCVLNVLSPDFVMGLISARDHPGDGPLTWVISI